MRVIARGRFNTHLLLLSPAQLPENVLCDFSLFEDRNLISSV